MRIVNIVLFMTFLVPSSSLADETDVNLIAAKNLSNQFDSEFRDQIVKRFEGSGLAPSEINRVVDSVVDGYAACVVEALTADPDPLAQELVQLLATAQPMEEIKDDLSSPSGQAKADKVMENLESNIQFCRFQVDQEAGLSSKPW